VSGAIEVATGGEAIVLGPDHPTTGGYPVLAVIVTADRGAFSAVPVGGVVRFVRSPGTS
jgi:allophanate hydrolase subunit 2